MTYTGEDYTALPPHECAPGCRHQRREDTMTTAAAAGTPQDCRGCGDPTDQLDLFPGGVCLACWAKSPEGRRMPTADEVVRMWGGPVRRKGRTR